MNKKLTNIRQHVGIDISKDTFMASIACQKTDFSIVLVSTKKFDNNLNGFEKLLIWTKSFTWTDIPLSFTMEATGIYRSGEPL